MSCQFKNYKTEQLCGDKVRFNSKFCDEHKKYFRCKKNLVKDCMFIHDFATGKSCKNKVKGQGKYCEDHINHFNANFLEKKKETITVTLPTGKQINVPYPEKHDMVVEY